MSQAHTYLNYVAKTKTKLESEMKVLQTRHCACLVFTVFILGAS